MSHKTKTRATILNLSGRRGHKGRPDRYASQSTAPKLMPDTNPGMPAVSIIVSAGATALPIDDGQPSLTTLAPCPPPETFSVRLIPEEEAAALFQAVQPQGKLPDPHQSEFYLVEWQGELSTPRGAMIGWRQIRLVSAPHGWCFWEGGNYLGESFDLHPDGGADHKWLVCAIREVQPQAVAN